MLEHGGRLKQAASRFHIKQSDWLDLSTGINPLGWPVNEVPANCWQQLPQDEDELLQSAGEYYQTKKILAVPGSQTAIQLLPTLRPPAAKVGIISPSYAEHAHCWSQQGHQVTALSSAETDKAAPDLDVLIVVNPNNPSGEYFTRTQLLHWHQLLQSNQGWLIVDEAFIDSRPEYSLSSLALPKGLIILRSLGKFFGLAGARVGFVISETSLLQQLEKKLGPWPIAGPSRHIAIKALQDTVWQQQTQQRLHHDSQRLKLLLSEYHLHPHGGCDLFQWVQTPQYESLHQQLCLQGILTRIYHSPPSIRFGLPAEEADWQRLRNALNQIEISRCYE